MNITYFNLKICFSILLACVQIASPVAAEEQTSVMCMYTLPAGCNSYTIQRDERGYLWPGTEHGARKSDGEKFLVQRDRFKPADRNILLSYKSYGTGQMLLMPLLKRIAYGQQYRTIFPEARPDLTFRLHHCAISLGSTALKFFSIEAQPQVLTALLPAWWPTMILAMACFIISVLLYWYIRRRMKQAALRKYEQARQVRRLAELELEVIKAQINPHFIYNCLNAIQYFNYERQHDLSRQYLDLFTRVIRFTMQYSRQPFISVTEEIAYLGHYLQLEKMRFHERLRYQIIVADNIEEQLMIPAMLIQPYVENALKHGIAPRKDGGQVIIRVDRPEDDLLEIMIEDDGIGFDPKKNTDKNALGFRLSGSRAETYNRLFDMNIQIKFHNKNNISEESGTIVQVKIPIRYHEHVLL